MKQFLGEDFLLETPTAEWLFSLASGLPIVDFHCHISPREIAEDVRFENLTQVWLGGDHYKWRAMRASGVDEHYITGDATDYEKFEQWAHTLPGLIGNPLYHWSHLELRRYFGIDLTLNPDNCQRIWDMATERLRTLSVRQIINQSNVEVICTTDDPADSLEYHQQLREDDSFSTRVVPAFRPDKAIQIEAKGFSDYIARLSSAAGMVIHNFQTLCLALEQRIEFFASLGCRAADHGLEYVPFVLAQEEQLDSIVVKALKGEVLTPTEADGYKTALLLRLSAAYHKRSWVMELHYGIRRNNNSRKFDQLGPDTGYDTIGRPGDARTMALFFDQLEQAGTLPRTLIFPAHPTDYALVNTLAGCFQSSEAKGKLQQGSAWWFNDTRAGMEKHLSSFAELAALGSFVGFLTDSRSFLSYTRHEYFRRILCNFLGNLVEKGEYPADRSELAGLIKNICYNNAIKYFEF